MTDSFETALGAVRAAGVRRGMNVLKNCRAFYLERARSGVGLMIPGMVPVRLPMGRKWLHEQEFIFMGPVEDLLNEIHQYYSKGFLLIGAGMGRAMLAVPLMTCWQRIGR